MDIKSSINTSVLSVGPQHTIRQVARAMTERKVGSAVVLTDDGHPAILTERDVLRAVASGDDLDEVTTEAYMTSDPTTAGPTWDVIDAAETMQRGGFRHLIVLDDRGSVAGILSLRDLTGSLLDQVKRA